jgi:hypothetical protein
MANQLNPGAAEGQGAEESGLLLSSEPLAGDAPLRASADEGKDVGGAGDADASDEAGDADQGDDGGGGTDTDLSDAGADAGDEGGADAMDIAGIDNLDAGPSGKDADGGSDN